MALADRRVRALAPHIGAVLTVADQRLLVWRAEPVEDELAPGEVAAEGGRLAVGFADGSLELLDVQPAGKRTMTAAELLRGWRGPVGPATHG